MRGVRRVGFLTVVALGMAACGASGAEEASPATAVSSSAGGAASQQALAGVTLTDEMVLMLGTMKLDEVGLAPDADQASGLLLLWQAYQSLGTSDTAAPQEMEAVLAQIESAMTEEQTAAIAAMDLDQEDLSGFMGSFRQESAAGQGSSGDGFFFSGGEIPGGAAGPGGGLVIPPGGPPGGFTTGDGGEGLSPEMRATALAGRTARAGNLSALFLLRPLIAELQALAGE